jgi:soluble P-type ATPase
VIEIVVPGSRTYRLEHLVLDYNGTLALDGTPIDGVLPRLRELALQLQVHVLTADTFRSASDALVDEPLSLTVIGREDQAAAKQAYVDSLRPSESACIGNGRNDRLLLQQAALGIAVLGPEGAALETLAAARVVARDINSALDLLLHPLRLVATLRD